MGYWITGAVILAALAGFVWWRRRRAEQEENDHPLLSMVAFLREPRYMEPAFLAAAARGAWGVELSVSEGDQEDEEDEENRDGFVVGGSPSSFVMYRGRAILVNTFPHPYVDDPQEAARAIPDTRIRQLVGEHKAWLSCDALSVDSFDENSVREWFSVLGPLLAELLDDDCVAIYIPYTDQLFPNMEETRKMLQAADPLTALNDESPVPVVEIRDDDPRMIAAVQTARDRFDEFVAAFEQRAGENFSVKAPISAQGNTEFIWLTVEAIENGVIYGKLANEPIDLGKLREGSQVRTKVEELNDWAYIGKDGETFGLFTVQVLAEAERDRQQDSQD